MAINLKTLSPSELESLIHTARSQLEHSRSRQIEEVRGKIEALLHEAGLTLGDVFPRIAGRGKKGKTTVAPKYRNPEDPSQTWTGRGKRPLWLAALLKKRGVTLESLLIDGDAKAPAQTARKGAAKSAKKAAPARAAKKAAKAARRTRKA
jgi:DNA-binding protein H-NS